MWRPNLKPSIAGAMVQCRLAFRRHTVTEGTDTLIERWNELAQRVSRDAEIDISEGSNNS